MTIELFLGLALEPALRLLPPYMDSPAARALVIAICLQESGLRYRRQIGGPARGYAQFEFSGVAGVLQHPQTEVFAREVAMRLDYAPSPSSIHSALEHNDVLAAVFARLLLWTVRDRLPGPDSAEVARHQYGGAWRPGKPRPDAWPANYARAWEAITGG